VPPGLASGL